MKEITGKGEQERRGKKMIGTHIVAYAMQQLELLDTARQLTQDLFFKRI